MFSWFGSFVSEFIVLTWALNVWKCFETWNIQLTSQARSDEHLHCMCVACLWCRCYAPQFIIPRLYPCISLYIHIYIYTHTLHTCMHARIHARVRTYVRTFHTMPRHAMLYHTIPYHTVIHTIHTHTHYSRFFACLTSVSRHKYLIPFVSQQFAKAIIDM